MTVSYYEHDYCIIPQYMNSENDVMLGLNEHYDTDDNIITEDYLLNNTHLVDLIGYKLPKRILHLNPSNPSYTLQG